MTQAGIVSIPNLTLPLSCTFPCKQSPTHPCPCSSRICSPRAGAGPRTRTACVVAWLARSAYQSPWAFVWRNKRHPVCFCRTRSICASCPSPCTSWRRWNQGKRPRQRPGLLTGSAFCIGYQIWKWIERKKWESRAKIRWSLYFICKRYMSKYRDSS